MSRPSQPEPANLIIGLIAAGRDTLTKVRPALEARFGAIDDESDVIDFAFTDYYQAEMGDNLVRTWLSFADLQPLDQLAATKLSANATEDEWRRPDGSRRINIDPGLLTKHNVVLATTKDYAHRIYLGQGIFAEVTLIFEHGEFRALKWTYPDYKSPAANTFLSRVRQHYLQKLPADSGCSPRLEALPS